VRDDPVVELALVRHVCAGRKRDWSGPDDQRPIDRVGVEQTAALVEFFDGLPISRLLASPALRCVQTLEPLADQRGLGIDTSERLRPEARPRELLDLLTAPDNHDAVLCTHGEAMARLLPALTRLHVAPGPGSRQRVLRKGSVWAFTVEPGPRPTIVSVQHHLPAGPRRCDAHAFDEVPGR
jgi:8-oxo-dGTP diphosphatase